MKNAYSGFIVCAAIALCTPCHAAELPEDELLSAARESREAPSVRGVDSELERRALATAGNYAFRNADGLVLSLNGRTAVFTDNPECEQDPEDKYGNKDYRHCGTYKLLAFSKIRDLFVLQQFFDKVTSYLVVDRHGLRDTQFGELPSLSPSGDFAVGVNYSQVYGEYKQYPNPHLEISERDGQYHVGWAGAPHYPKKGAARYVVDGWRNDDISVARDQRAVELDVHLEVDGKTTARFKVTRVPDADYKVTDVPQ